MMKTFFLLTLGLSASVWSGSVRYDYRIDATNIASDSFFVHLDVSGLEGDSAVFQFAATAPGTYQVLNVGRFVGGFEALDENGRSLNVARRGDNQFVIRPAAAVRSIRYQVDDSYDTEIREWPVYPMAGSNLENDNAVINGHMVAGYFHGHQDRPLRVHYILPETWTIGTSMELKDGWYYASTFDDFVDSPVIAGRLSSKRLKIGKTHVDVFVYSQNEEVQADRLSDAMKDVLHAADRFLKGLPVERYAFLFHFRKSFDSPFYGALEHQRSSFYALPEAPMELIAPQVVSFAAHEFFHIVTPLHIHSDVIARFNFESPVPSRHLWFYEGTTEWASLVMQVRSGLMTPRQFIDEIGNKLRAADRYRRDISLVDLSLGAYDVHVDQYPNVYEKGALVSLFLDMRLLELSNGKVGWRDVVRQLTTRFGPHHAFADDEFFDILVEMTYPEVGDFVHRYIEGTEPLPVANYLAMAGYQYVDSLRTGQFQTNIGTFDFGVSGNDIVVKNLDEQDTVNVRLGIRNGDVVLRLKTADGEINIRDGQFAARAALLQAGQPFVWIVQRDGREIACAATVGQREIIARHRIMEMDRPTRAQKQFRSRWLKNN